MAVKVKLGLVNYQCYSYISDGQLSLKPSKLSTHLAARCDGTKMVHHVIVVMYKSIHTVLRTHCYQLFFETGEEKTPITINILYYSLRCMTSGETPVLSSSLQPTSLPAMLALFY